MWVKLLRQKQVLVQGRPTVKGPGDWVDVGRHVANRWIAEGDAVVQEKERKSLLPDDCGLLLTTQHEGGETVLGRVPNVATGAPQLLWRHTLIYEPFGWEPTMLETGYVLLDRWQMVVPILSFDRLACHAGTEEERDYTQRLIGDLRVLLYDHRLLWVKRCPETEYFITTWNEEHRRFAYGDDGLSLLRALYIAKPLVSAVPPNWSDGEVMHR